jgi:hypothetical protein
MSQQEQSEQEARSVARINWNAEPLESQLADLTLWPGPYASLALTAVPGAPCRVSLSDRTLFSRLLQR